MLAGVCAMAGVEQDRWDVLEGEILEVFSPGAPIREKDLFSGRLDQIRQLLDAVRKNAVPLLRTVNAAICDFEGNCSRSYYQGR